MANINTTYSLTDNKYTIAVTFTDLSAAETELLSDFGTPKITIGGTIDPTNAALFEADYTPECDAAFNVPSQQRNLDANFSYSTFADGDIDSAVQVASSKPLAEAKMNDLASHIKRMISDAWSILDGKSDAFTRDEVDTVTAT